MTGIVGVITSFASDVVITAKVDAFLEVVIAFVEGIESFEANAETAIVDVVPSFATDVVSTAE